jgi:hypothetical protein
VPRSSPMPLRRRPYGHRVSHLFQAMRHGGWITMICGRDSLFLEKHSLMRVWKFPVPLRREFGFKLLDLRADQPRKSGCMPVSAKFPVNFPVSREFGAETGSNLTASSATQSGLSVSLLVSAGCRKPSLALGHRAQSFLRLVKNLSSPERTDQRPQLKSPRVCPETSVRITKFSEHKPN